MVFDGDRFTTDKNPKYMYKTTNDPSIIELTLPFRNEVIKERLISPD
jgi:hypothetical protein